MKITSKLSMRAGVSAVMSEIIIGVVVLFVGVFMLSSVEPMFDLDECAFTSAAGDANATLDQETLSGLQNYTAPTITGPCWLYVHQFNITGNSSTVSVYDYSDGSLIQTLTATATNTVTNFTISPTASSTFAVNYTVDLTGGDEGNITVDSTTSSVYCCSSMVRKDSVAGQTYDQTVNSAGMAFTVFGLILIIVGLATAIGTLKQGMGQ